MSIGNTYMNMSNISIKIKNYKCFRDEFAGFDKILPINIIIGRNNSGKSAMLDLLDFATDISKKTDPNAILQIEDDLAEVEIKNVFKPGIQEGGLSGTDHWIDHGQMLVGLRVRYDVDNKKITKFEWVNPEQFTLKNPSSYSRNDPAVRKERMDKFMRSYLRNPMFFRDKVIRRILADRDIRIEGMNSDQVNMNISGSGNGATNMISSHIHHRQFDRDIVQKKMLCALNEVFGPDNIFREITARVDRGSSWEVFLGEEQKGLIPLSMSGSGLKTVILVLLNLIVMPLIKSSDNRIYPITDHIFAFEELENNLHPAVLRRLFTYIERFAVENKCHFFITTHSSVVVDQFSRSPHAQIIHVSHDGTQSRTATVSSFDGHSAILDNIGAKASDLLQANGIVWLEGPSDRIYFNKWVEIYSNGNLREHRDYECAFYGGSVLKHFTADDPAGDSDAINVLRVNRNAILIGDSDKVAADSLLKHRLEKMRDAIQDMGAYIWITEAKEIENYIPASAIEKMFTLTSLPEIGQYEYFHRETNGTNSKANIQSDYWHKHSLSGAFDKVELARDTVPHLSKEALTNRFDIEKQMDKICALIRKWNR